MQIVTTSYENRSCFFPGPVPWPGSKGLFSRLQILRFYRPWVFLTEDEESARALWLGAFSRAPHGENIFVFLMRLMDIDANLP